MRLNVKHDFELSINEEFEFFANLPEGFSPYIEYTGKFIQNEDGEQFCHITWIDPDFNEEDGMVLGEEHAIEMIEEGYWVVLNK